MFLLRPDRETNETFLYCLAEAARRFEIEVILPSVLSNHHHIVLFDRYGRIVEFTEHLHKLVAKAMNALRGRSENFWSSEPPCIVRLVDAGDVVDKIVYAAINPVKDHLVERVADWPGVNGLAAFVSGQAITVRRPRHFFRERGSMPVEVTLDLVVPPELGDPEQIRRLIRERVAALETQLARERKRTHTTVLGRRGVLTQSWRASPSTPSEPSSLRPRVAARNVWQRAEALLRDREFLTAYRAAFSRWRNGLFATFPMGTYWLRRFASVPVVTAAA